MPELSESTAVSYTRKLHMSALNPEFSVASRVCPVLYFRRRVERRPRRPLGCRVSASPMVHTMLTTH